MASSIFFNTWIYWFTFYPVSTVTSLTLTVTLSRSNIDTVGILMAAAPVWLHAVIDLLTLISVSPPPHKALADVGPGTGFNALRIDTAAPSFRVGTGIYLFAGRSISLIALFADTADCSTAVVTGGMCMAKLDSRTTWTCVPLTEFTSVVRLARAFFTSTTALWAIVTFSMNTRTFFITVGSVFLMAGTQMTSGSPEVFFTYTSPIPTNSIHALAMPGAGVCKASRAGATDRPIETFAAKRHCCGFIAVLSTPQGWDVHS